MARHPDSLTEPPLPTAAEVKAYLTEIAAERAAMVAAVGGRAVDFDCDAAGHLPPCIGCAVSGPHACTEDHVGPAAHAARVIARDAIARCGGVGLAAYLGALRLSVTPPKARKGVVAGCCLRGCHTASSLARPPAPLRLGPADIFTAAAPIGRLTVGSGTMAQYSGGKTFTIKRYGLGTELAWWLNTLKPSRIFDLTAGSGAPLEFITAHYGQRAQGGVDFFGPEAPLIVGSDLHPAAVCLLRKLAEGYRPPSVLTEDEHARLGKIGAVPLKACEACSRLVHGWSGNPSSLGHHAPNGGHTCPASYDPVHGFAGFGCSFGAVYYSGYGGRSRPKYRDPVGSVSKVYAKAAPLLARVDAWHTGDYRAIYGLPGSAAIYTARSGDLVYIDIPYKGTTGYKGLPPFDHAAFWAWVEALAVFGVTVLTSEFSAPAPFERAWCCTRQVESRSGIHGGGKPAVEDGLWVHPLQNRRRAEALEYDACLEREEAA